MILSEYSGNFICDTLAGLFNGGAVLFHTSADAEVAKCTMNDPAFSAASNGAADMIASPAVKDYNTQTGTIDHAHLTESDGTIRTKHTCGLTSASEFVFLSLYFEVTNTLEVTAMAIVFPVETIA